MDTGAPRRCGEDVGQWSWNARPRLRSVPVWEASIVEQMLCTLAQSRLSCVLHSERAQIGQVLRIADKLSEQLFVCLSDRAEDADPISTNLCRVIAIETEHADNPLANLAAVARFNASRQFPVCTNNKVFPQRNFAWIGQPPSTFHEIQSRFQENQIVVVADEVRTLLLGNQMVNMESGLRPCLPEQREDTAVRKLVTQPVAEALVVRVTGRAVPSPVGFIWIHKDPL